MPSAANAKVEKQQVQSENNVPDSSGNALTPMRQAITVIEHKIRNLEKRKAKLESYRELQNSGKELNQDQKIAVAKYDEVIQTLEFARDLCKQFLGIANVSEKEAKKQARKEAAARSQAELAKIREVLLVQDALNQMGQDNVREDFLNGTNGATQLSSADLKLLDDIYPAVTPKHEPGDPTAFTNQVQAAAEHLLAVVDGKPKEAFGATYSQIKEVIGKVHESGYLDQALVTSYEETEEIIENDQLTAAEVPIAQPEIQHQEVATPIETLEIKSMVVRLPSPSNPQPQPPLAQPAPEQIYYQQPPRPITEMLGSGSFFFLQDSELDTPDTLPTQTFTNTSFVQPPPPIPLPPNFQPYPPQPGNPVAVPPAPSGNGIEEPSKVSQQIPQQTPVVQSQQLQQQPPSQPEVPQKSRPLAPKTNHGSSQPFYQNNRPRPNRNAPRAGGGNRYHQ